MTLCSAQGIDRVLQTRSCTVTQVAGLSVTKVAGLYPRAGHLSPHGSGSDGRCPIAQRCGGLLSGTGEIIHPPAFGRIARRVIASTDHSYTAPGTRPRKTAAHPSSPPLATRALANPAPPASAASPRPAATPVVPPPDAVALAPGGRSAPPPRPVPPVAVPPPRGVRYGHAERRIA